MKVSAVLLLCGLALVAGAPPAQPGSQTASVTIQFDNRGNKVMSDNTRSEIEKALAKYVFMVPAGNVKQSSGIGQSTITNHQSVVTYLATGPTTNGKSLVANCEANTKNGFFSSSEAKKAIKKATDSWLPGDSVKVQSAKCSAGQPVNTAPTVGPNAANPGTAPLATPPTRQMGKKMV
jgi:hypothetical protein